jgi:hypothetical protein
MDSTERISKKPFNFLKIGKFGEFYFGPTVPE